MAPIVAALAKWGLGTLASAVMAKGKDVVEEKLGVNLEEAIGTEEGRFKLRQLAVEHEQFLITAAQADENRALDYFRTEIADKGSARIRDTEFLKAGMVNWRANVMFGLAVVMVAWLVWIVWKDSTINEYVKGIFTLVLGRFLGYLDNIYNYEFGTTRINRTKDTSIENLTAKLTEGKQ